MHGLLLAQVTKDFVYGQTRFRLPQALAQAHHLRCRQPRSLQERLLPKELRRRRVEHDFTVTHKHQAIHILGEEIQIMRNNQDGFALLVQRRDDPTENCQLACHPGRP